MKKWVPLGLLSAAMFIIVIDTTIMNVSISALIEDLDTTVSGVQGAISLYALVMASFILIGGKLADIIGKRRTFTLGLVIFGIGTTTASFATNLTMLIIGWSIIEGLGSALMLPNTQTLLRAEYDGKERALGYGVVSAVAAAGAAVGPIVGGYLTTEASWRWAFRLEVVVVIAVLALVHNLQPDPAVEERPRFDFVGASLSITGLAGVVLSILLGQTYGFWLAEQPFELGGLEIAPFGLSVVPFMFGIGALLLLALFRWEAHLESTGGSGLFRPSVFAIGGLLTGFWVRFAQMAINAAFLFGLPLLVQLTFGFSAIKTGLFLLPFSIAVLVFAIGGARLSSRFSAKGIIQVGFIVVIAGLGLMIATIQVDSGPEELSYGIVFGAGVGLIASQILNLNLSSGSDDQTPEIAGINGTFEQLGNALGVAIIGTIMLGTLTAGLNQSIASSEALPDAAVAPLEQAVDEGVELMSDAQLEAGLDAAGVDDATRVEIKRIYGDERVRAFRAGMLFIALLAVGALIVSTGLSSRKLVDAEEAEPAAQR